jgi:hypothetical protein
MLSEVGKREGGLEKIVKTLEKDYDDFLKIGHVFLSLRIISHDENIFEQARIHFNSSLKKKIIFNYEMV